MKKDSSGKCPLHNIDGNTKNILQYLRAKIKEKTHGSDDKKPRRIFHAKSIGLVKGTMEVENITKDRLKIGLFTEAKSYDVLIRFTNGGSNVKGKDIEKTARGMAIKILGAGNRAEKDKHCQDGNHDIILFNGRTFVPGIKELQLDGVRFILGDLFIKFLSITKVLAIHARGLCRFISNTPIKTPNILEEMYFSATPYSFGKEAIKWHARPLKTITSTIPENPTDNYLRYRLIKDLLKNQKEKIAFALYVQFQENEETEPINDTGVLWNTAFHHVATIHIPWQDIETKERIELDEQTWFSPGNAHPGHEPLGDVNAIRSKVYPTLAKERIDQIKYNIDRPGNRY